MAEWAHYSKLDPEYAALAAQLFKRREPAAAAATTVLAEASSTATAPPASTATVSATVDSASNVNANANAGGVGAEEKALEDIKARRAVAEAMLKRRNEGAEYPREWLKLSPSFYIYFPRGRAFRGSCEYIHAWTILILRSISHVRHRIEGRGA